MKNLAKTGLSLSQAQSISNQCFQKCVTMEQLILNLNTHSKNIIVDGIGYEVLSANPVPADILAQLQAISRYHACQAFLRESMQAKDKLMAEIKNKIFTPTANTPDSPEYHKLILKDYVNEQNAWDNLTATEQAEYLDVETQAAHIGKFIHKDGHLTKMRNHLAKLPNIEWTDVKVGEKTPIRVTKHHTETQLLKIHEKLAKVHREAEQKVNYFKSKMKNWISEENAKINKLNAEEQANIQAKNSEIREAHETAMRAYSATIGQEISLFEAQRNLDMKEAAALRITVDPRFQPVIDELLISSED